jgi:phosphoribosylformylglycinamidine (FGAM) synthase-like amidotransferase family enzyme
MAKTKTHPADLAERALIRDATGFTASIFIGAGQFERANAAALREARQHAATFSERIKNGRKPMIYAGLADGRQIFVPDDYQPTELTMTTATETKSITAPAAVKPTKKKTTAKKKIAKKASAKKAVAKKAGREDGAAKTERPLGQRAAILAAVAEAGKLPRPRISARRRMSVFATSWPRWSRW